MTARARPQRERITLAFTLRAVIAVVGHRDCHREAAGACDPDARVADAHGPAIPRAAAT
jgi:hypothetical protein